MTVNWIMFAVLAVEYAAVLCLFFRMDSRKSVSGAGVE